MIDLQPCYCPSKRDYNIINASRILPLCQPNTGHINQSSGQFPSRLGHVNSFSTWSRFLLYIVEIYNNTWKALCSTCVHPSTAPCHQGVSIWRDSAHSLPFSKGQTPSFYSCKQIRRLLLVFSSHTHASAGFLLPWLHGILTCDTRIVFRHTPLLLPHLSSLSKLLHRTAKARGWWPRSRSSTKYFFDGLCFFEWTWPFWTPLKAFREEAVWFKQRKTRRKVAPFLTPLGAARAARSPDWLKIGMWENPSFDSSRSRQLVGTLRCALSLSSHLHFNSSSSLACLSSACISHWACYWKRSSPQR